MTRASLQATENNQILNPNQMFHCTTQNIVGIIFCCISDEEVTSNIKAYKLKQRYSSCPTVPGSRISSLLYPSIQINFSNEKLKRLSSDEEEVKVKLYNDDNVSSIRSHEQLLLKFTTWKICCLLVSQCMVHWCCN